MKKIFLKINPHKRTLLSLTFILLYSITIAYATPPLTPYNSGETLDPSCIPGSANCFVSVGGSINGFVQDGNNFGSLTTLGTNDSQDLVLETNGLERLRVSNTGNVNINNTLTLSSLSIPGILKNNASGLVSSSLITNADISATAAIAYSKLNLANSIVTGDIVDGTLLFADLASNSCTAGQVPSYNGTTWVCASALTNTLANNTVLIGNASNTATAVTLSGDVSSTNTGVLTIANGAVNSAKILDGTIVNVDINPAANISLSKLANGTNIVTSLSAPSGSNVNGGSIASNVLTLSFADGSNPGIVSTGVQSFGGDKIFVDGLIANGSNSSTNVFVQNGNSFGSEALLGTQDNNGLSFITQGTQVGRFDIFGNFAGNASNTFTGPVIGSIAFGESNTVSTAGKMAYAFGQGNNLQNNSDFNFAVGLSNTNKDGSFNTFFGDTNQQTSSGTYNFVAGRNNIFDKDFNFIFGDNVNATGLGNNLILGNGGINTRLAIDGSDSYLNLLGGNVGIGTSSPSQKLDVAGNLNIQGGIFANGNPGSSGQVLTSTSGGVNTWTSPVSFGAITLVTGTTGTNVNVSGSPASLGGTLTLNIPDASTLARGLVTNGAQTFGGAKSFSSAPTISPFTTAGIVKNSSAGLLSSGLILNTDITNGTIDLTTKVTGILPIANGGTGSSIQNFVDLTTTQLVGGLKSFSSLVTAQNGLTLTATPTTSASTYDLLTRNTTTGAVEKILSTSLPLGTGTTDYLARWTGANTLGIGSVRDDGVNVGIGGAPNALYKLDVGGDVRFSGILNFNNNVGRIKNANNEAIVLPGQGGVVPGYFYPYNNLNGWNFLDTTNANSLAIKDNVLSMQNTFDAGLVRTSVQFAWTSMDDYKIEPIPAVGYHQGTNLLLKAGNGGVGGVDQNGITGNVTISGGNATGGFANTPGGKVLINGGRGAGSATGGDIIFQTSSTGASGTVVQSLSDRMIIKDGSGNVGINTTTPTYKLDVNGDTRISGALRLNNVDGVLSIISNNLDGNSSPLNFTNNGRSGGYGGGYTFMGGRSNSDGALAMRIYSGTGISGDDSRNAVGIGDISEGKLQASIRTRLAVKTRVPTGSELTNDTAIVAYGNVAEYNTSTGKIFNGLYVGMNENTNIPDQTFSNFGVALGMQNQPLVNGYGTSMILSATQDTGFLSEVMRLSGATGNVGIGTSTPANKLDVNGGVNFSGNLNIGNIAATYPSGININSAGSNNHINLTRTLSGGDAAIRLGDNILSLNFINNSSLNPTPIMKMLFTGEVGIGTSSPSYKLDVNGTTNTLGFRMPTGAVLGSVLTSDAAGLAAWQTPAVTGWGLTGNSGTNSGTNFIGTNDLQDFVIKTNGAERMKVLSSGNIGIGTSNPLRRLHVDGDGILVGTDEGSTGDYVKILKSNGSGHPEITLFDIGAFDAKLSINNTNFSMNTGLEVIGLSSSASLRSAGLVSAGPNGFVAVPGELLLAPPGGSPGFINFSETGVTFHSTLGVTATTGDLIYKTSPSSSTTFDGTERFRVLKSNGNFLLGTSTDSGYKLDVNGDIRTSGVNYQTYGTASLNLLVSGATPTTADRAINIGNNNSITGIVATGLGNIVSAAGTGAVAIGYTSNVSGGGIAISSGGQNASTISGIAIGGASSSTGGIAIQGTSTGNSIMSIGSGSSASGVNAISIGASVINAGNYSTVIGDRAVIGIGHNQSIALGLYSKTSGSNQFVSGGSNGGLAFPISDVYFGTGPQGDLINTMSGSSYTINGSGGFGNNQNGGAITIAGGKGTGTGNAGDINFSTSILGASGTTLQSLSQKMTLKGGSGNFLIGDTTDLGYKLQVGSSSVSGIVASFTNSSGSCTINPTAGIACSSDQRLKKNIATLDDSYLPKIMSLKPVKYNWNNELDTDGLHNGFIAQDLEQVFPDLVATDANGMKSVFYTNLIPYTIKAIQEINIEILGLNNLEKPNGFRDSLVAWMGNAGNRITRIFTGEICLTDSSGSSECINKTELRQLKQLLQNQTAPVPNPTPTPEVPPIIDPNTP
jgi:Chaperone of endosialidase